MSHSTQPASRFGTPDSDDASSLPGPWLELTGILVSPEFCGTDRGELRIDENAAFIRPVRLPNGARADLGTKLEDYTLNPMHRDGRHKARVFESVLGITLANANLLRTALLEVASNSEAAVAQGDNGFGETYVLRFALRTDKGAATVLSAWIIRHGEDFPRLATCYIV